MGRLAAGYLVALAYSMLAVWLALALTIIVKRTDREAIASVLRLPREIGHLTTNLLRDETLPGAVRVRIWLLAAYLASPVDLIPDILPFVGYLDDIAVTAILMRGAGKRVGYERLAAAWDGDARGLDAVARLCGLKPPPAPVVLLVEGHFVRVASPQLDRHRTAA